MTSTSKAAPQKDRYRTIAAGIVEVLSGASGTVYRCDLAAGTCQCAGFVWRGACRHLRGAAAWEAYQAELRQGEPKAPAPARLTGGQASPAPLESRRSEQASFLAWVGVEA